MMKLIKEIVKKENGLKIDRPKEANQILEEQIETGLIEFRRSGVGLFLSAFAAGLEIGFSLLLMGVIYNLFGGEMSEGSLSILISLSYALGFIFVILGRSELFTEHTALAVIPVLNKSESVSSLVKLWVLVYLGNIIGGYIISLILTNLGPAIGFMETGDFVFFAEKLTQYSGKIIFFSSILAGWMMGLLGWLISSSQDSLTRVFMIILVTGVISLGGFHHCIIGSVEVFSGMLVSPDLSIKDYGKFQIWATLGNALGGVVFVALLKFSHAKRS